MAEPNTRNWKAWLDLQPGAGSRLHVVGEVEVSATNKHPVLTHANPQGIISAVLILDLTIVQFGLGNQVVTWRDAHYPEAPVKKGQYSQVEIRFEGAPVATIDEIGETQ